MKKIKVRITSTLFNYEGKQYVAGDVLTITEDAFVSYIMEKIEEPAKTEKMEPFEKEEKVVVTKEGIETLGPGEEPSAPEIKPTPKVEEAKEKPKRKRKA